MSNQSQKCLTTNPSPLQWIIRQAESSVTFFFTLQTGLMKDITEKYHGN